MIRGTESDFKYMKVVHHILKLAEEGHLKAGDRLPSIRKLCEEFSINKSTVISALDFLINEHVIYAIAKSGYYYIGKKNEIEESQEIINFIDVLPDPLLMPFREFNHCINKATELYKYKLFSYCEAQGLLQLRKTLVGHLAKQQVYTSEDHIYITSGAQQALNLICLMEFPNHKNTVVIEQPTYSLIQRILELSGYIVKCIDRVGSDIDVVKLENILKEGNVAFVYTIPRYQNPTGTSYSEKTKLKLISLSVKYNTYIVEDDYLSDIGKFKKAPPLRYYDTNDKVIYIKSFSKTFMPGVRIGAVVLPNELKNEFLIKKKYDDLNTSVLTQGALEVFISNGMYEHHIKRIEKAYGKKMKYAMEVMRNLNTSLISHESPENGFFLWLKMDDSVDIQLLIEKLSLRSIHVQDPSEFYLFKETHQNSLRLCISNLTNEQIRTGLMTVYKEVELKTEELYHNLEIEKKY